MSKIKLLVVLLLCIFLLPFMVNAEECNPNSIKIQSISVKDKSEYTEELSNITFENNKINLDLKMYDVGDYIEYKLKVKNESKENFYFDEKSLNINSNYFDYSLSYKDNSNRIEPNTEKIIYLRVEYKKEVEKENFFSGKYKDSNIVSLLLTDNKRSIFTNPLTGSNKIILLLITMIILGIYLYYKKTNNIRLNIFIIIGLSLLIPISTYALCEVKLDINSNITIGKVKPNPCTYDGELVQGAEYVNGQYTYRYMQEGGWNNIDEDGWGVILTDKESTDEVTTKLCTSINDKPIVSTSFMFADSKASNFDVSSFDTSNVTNMNYMFTNSGDIAKSFIIQGLDNFDTSKVENMSCMFSGAAENATTFNIGDLSNWDTSKVTDMNYMFSAAGYSSTIFDLDLSNWDTSNVTTMIFMFNASGYSATTWEIGDLSNWDTSNVTNMMLMFSGAAANATAFNIGDLSNWDTSKVTSMDAMFAGAGNNASTWNSIGTLKIYASDISSMFQSSPNVKATLNIYNNPTNYGYMFSGSATKNESKIIVNYKSNVTNIDSIINTKSSDSNVIKGIIIN